jgi:O-antigen/teichoic acid export membrane protein
LKKVKRKIYTISKKAGDRLGFDLPYFVENGFWVVLSQFVQLSASFAASVVFARYLTKETFGEYQLFVSICGMLTLFSFPGLGISILRSVAKGADYSYIQGVKFSFKTTLLTIPIFVGLAAWYYFHGKQQLGIAFICAGLLFSFIHAHDKWNSYWNAKEKFEKVSKQEIIQSLILNVLLIFSAIFFSNYLVAITGVYLFVYTGFNTFWHYRIKVGITEKRIDEDCIPYGKYMTRMAIFTGVILYFDKIIIGFFDLKMLAVFGIALKLFDIIKQVLKSIYSVSSPKFVKKNVTIGREKVIFLFLVGLLISVFLYFIAEPIIIFVYTDSYKEAVILFKKLVFALPFVFVTPLFSYRANATKQKNKIIHTYITVPVITIIVSVSILVFTGITEYFLLAKVYVMQIAYFFILVPLTRNSVIQK